MNKLPLEKRVAVLSALVEGNSLRSTSRMVGVSINTVTKMLVDAGNACAKYQREVMKDLPCHRLQLDEIWSFCAMKQKNIPAERRDEFGIGDVWTWVAICAESKLVPCWLVGLRDSCHAVAFVKDLASRLTNRVQVTSDGLRTYIEAMEQGFGGAVDYAMLVKIYSPEGSKQSPETRYSPGECCGTETNIVTGQPEEAHISTSFVERQNLTMRMKMRRFTRLTNGFSKKFENHEHSVALHFFHYNFIRRHQTLRMPPALKAGVADHWWTLEELAELIERESR
jgi:IS1 family transposase